MASHYAAATKTETKHIRLAANNEGGAVAGCVVSGGTVKGTVGNNDSSTYVGGGRFLINAKKCKICAGFFGLPLTAALC